MAQQHGLQYNPRRNKTIRPKSSIVWEYFTLNRSKTYVSCRLCRTDLVWHGSTTVMRVHLKSKHVHVMDEEDSAPGRKLLTMSGFLMEKSGEVYPVGYPVEQSHRGVFQTTNLLSPSLDPSIEHPPKISLHKRASNSKATYSSGASFTSTSESYPDFHSSLALPAPTSHPTPPTSFSSFPTNSSSVPSLSSSSSSPLPSHLSASACPAPTSTFLHGLLPSSSSSSSSSSSHHLRPDSQPRPEPAGIQEELARCAWRSLEEQQQSRVLLVAVGQSLGTVARSVQGLVESQKEFVHDSLQLQREMVDMLKDFSTNAMALLRDKVNGHPPL